VEPGHGLRRILRRVDGMAHPPLGIACPEPPYWITRAALLSPVPVALLPMVRTVALHLVDGS
jgi:hypothetical protein